METIHKYTNQQLADIFLKIANLLEIKGEVIYKILAYRKAADSLANLSQDVTGLWQAGKLTEIPGVGKAISEKIEELLVTGKLGFLERLEQEVPVSLIEILKVPDVGPKKVALFWKELNITDLASLEKAARSGKLRGLPGMGEKSEVRILSGLEALARRSNRIPLGKAWPAAQEILTWLRQLPQVSAAEPAGSLRRGRESVGDLDLLAASNDPVPVMAAFTGRSDVQRVLGQGEVKSSVEFTNGLRAQLWVHPPEHFGTALQYATGSKDHNVRLRELAQKQGLSLSEHSLARADGSEIYCSNEEEVYRALGLPWISPELREDHGEIEAALAGKLPHLIESTDLIAEFHCHSTWSDGKASIQIMAEAARALGLKTLAITDHTASLGIANGLSVERLKQQRLEIDAVQVKMGDSIHILQGAEVEIQADGSLDYPDDVLAALDLVIAALHVSLRQPRQQVTERLIKAMRNPHVDIIAHLTGRLLPDREGADLDMPAVMATAQESGVALEINAHPARLDLNDVYTRHAVDMKIPLALNTDAHGPQELGQVQFGILTARRGWAEPEHVINTWTYQKLRKWLNNRQPSSKTSDLSS